MSAILFSRAIGPVPIPVVVSEAPESVLEITEIPLEDGSVATDHAHSAPFRIALEIASETLTLTYQELVQWQKQRVPFTYVSGFDVHPNLLIKRIEPERRVESGRIFRGRIDLQEVIIVSSGSAPNDGTSGKGGAKKPGGAKSRRAATPNASRASASAADKAAGTVSQGDVRTNPVDPNSAKGKTILKSLGF